MGKPSTKSVEETNLIIKLFKEGNNFSQIAKKLCRSTQFVTDILAKNGEYTQKKRNEVKDLVFETVNYREERIVKYKGSLLIAEGKGWWDWTSYPQWGVESPSICKIPQWKRDFQRKGLTYFGKEYK